MEKIDDKMFEALTELPETRERRLLTFKAGFILNNYTRAVMKEDGFFKRLITYWPADHEIIPVDIAEPSFPVNFGYYNAPRFGYLRVVMTQPRSLFADFTAWEKSGGRWGELQQRVEPDHRYPALLEISCQRCPKIFEFGFARAWKLDCVEVHQVVFEYLRKLRRIAHRRFSEFHNGRQTRLVKQLQQTSWAVYRHGVEMGFFERNYRIPGCFMAYNNPIDLRESV